MISSRAMFQMTFEGLLENDVPEQELEVDEKKRKNNQETCLKMAGTVGVGGRRVCGDGSRSDKLVYSTNTQRHTISPVFAVCCSYHLVGFSSDARRSCNLSRAFGWLVGQTEDRLRYQM